MEKNCLSNRAVRLRLQLCVNLAYSNIFCGSVGANPLLPKLPPPGVLVVNENEPPGNPPKLEKPPPGPPAPDGGAPPPFRPSSPNWS